MNLNAFRVLNKLGSFAWLVNGDGNSQQHGTSHEFPGQDGHRALAVLLAVMLALPAVGMMAGGFASDRPWLGWAGVGIFLGMAFFYVIVAWQVLSSLS